MYSKLFDEIVHFESEFRVYKRELSLKPFHSNATVLLIVEYKMLVFCQLLRVCSKFCSMISKEKNYNKNKRTKN